MKTLLIICSIGVALYYQSCLSSVPSKTENIQDMPSNKYATPEEMPQVSQGTSVIFDGRNYIKKDGWLVPNLKQAKLVLTTDESFQTVKKKDTQVRSELFSFEIPVVYTLAFSYKERGLDNLKGRLETPWFRTFSVDGKIFMYSVFAKVIEDPAPSNSSSGEERIEYQLKDEDGDGIFETMVATDDNFRVVPEWALKK